MLKPLVALFTVGLLADVVPHCGGPEVVIQPPGADCGHHGPRWRGDCSAPAGCFNTEDQGRMCTKACEQDADCAPLGPDFACNSQGAPDADPEPRTRRKVCGRTTNASKQ